MRLPGERGMLSYLAALSLTLSIVESALPHSLPFLRLGLANLALLWGLKRLTVKDYLLLLVLKWFLSALVSGIILSPYALVSLVGNLASGLVMHIVYRLFGRWLSFYSISALGAAASGALQLLTSTIFLTSAVLDLMPLMLLFSTVSGLLIAFIHYRLEVPSTVVVEKSNVNCKVPYMTVVFALLGLVAVLFLQGIGLLLAAFALSLLLCHFSGRKIKPIYYLVSIVSVVAFNLLVPSGRVIFMFVTEDALLTGIESALRLATLVAFSQSLATMPLDGLGVMTETMNIQARLSASFFSGEGKIRERLANTLSIDHFAPTERKDKESRTGLMAIFSLLLAALALIQFLI